MENERSNITISEEFLIRNMLGYDEYEPPMREIMAKQNHVDIRTFANQSKEEWTAGTYGVTGEVANFNHLKLAIPTGTFETQSVTPTKPLDLITEFEPTDVISLALPKFPLSKINTTLSFIDFTSHPEGNFAVGPTVSIAFSQSVTTLTEGNSEFRIPRSEIESNELNLKAITGVRFRISSTGESPKAANLILNPNFNHDVVNTTPAAWVNKPTGLVTNIIEGATYGVVNTTSHDEASEGAAQSLTVSTTNSTTNQGTGIALPESYTFKKGVTYSASVWLKGAAGAEALEIVLGNAPASDTKISKISLTKEWVKYTVSWTPTADRAGGSFVIRTEKLSKVSIFIDEVIVAEGGAPTYVDGDREGFEWSGTPGNSITNKNATSFFAMGLRLLDSSWVQGPVDYDNWNGRWTNTPPSTGNVTNPAAFKQPILWRSANPPGENDPRPIDSEIGIIFYTGELEHNNTFMLYLREVSKAFLTQLDIDGTTQSELDGKPQPDLGVSEYAPRLMTDMDRFKVESLDTMDMFNIERVSDPVFTGWIQFTLQWGPTNTISISNSSASGYVFEGLPSLKANTRYLLICSLEDTSARATIHEVNGDYSINPTAIFDTTLIDDDNLFKRRKGRIGWQASFGDNSAFIDHIRVRHLNFAEYRSAPLKSITPVRGAKLFTDFTQDTQLWQGFEADSENTQTGSHITRDTARSTTGESYRIDVYGTAEQGFLSNPLIFTDFSQAEISFDLWYPAALITEALSLGQTPGIKLQLVGLYENPTINIHLPIIQTEQWQHVAGIELSSYDLNQTGRYALSISQPSAAAGSWWIDNVKVLQRAIQWSARSVTSNPWESNYAPWTDFRNLVNSETNGIIFSTQGKELQLRARALRQDANIVQSPKIVPTYAELGRLVWPENALKGLTPPIAEFSTPTPLTPFVELPTLDPLTETTSGYYATGNWAQIPWASFPLVPQIGGAGLKSFGTQTGSDWVHPFKGNTAVSIRRAFGFDIASRFWELWLCLNPSTHSGYRALFTLLTGEAWKCKLFSVSGGTETKLGESASSIEAVENQQFGLIREGSELGAYYKNPLGTWTELVSAIDSTFAEGRLGFGGQGSDPSFLEFQGGNISAAPELSYQFVSSSSPGSGAIVLYEWTFGDGARATGATATHTYLHHGTYQVTLTVTDRYGQQAQFTRTLVV